MLRLHTSPREEQKASTIKVKDEVEMQARGKKWEEGKIKAVSPSKSLHRHTLWPRLADHKSCPAPSSRPPANTTSSCHCFRSSSVVPTYGIAQICVEIMTCQYIKTNCEGKLWSMESKQSHWLVPGQEEKKKTERRDEAGWLLGSASSNRIIGRMNNLTLSFLPWSPTSFILLPSPPASVSLWRPAPHILLAATQ